MEGDALGGDGVIETFAYPGICPEYGPTPPNSGAFTAISSQRDRIRHLLWFAEIYLFE